MAVSQYALCSLAYIKRILGIDQSNTDHDTLLEPLIDAVSIRIEELTLRQFVSRTHVEEKDGEGENWIHLDNYPVTVLHSLFDDVNRVWSDGSLISSDNYILIEDEGTVILEGIYAFNDGRRNVRARYTGGYADTDSLPADLQYATALVVAYAYSRVDKHQFGIASVTVSDKTVVYSNEAWPKEALDIIMKYRDVNV